MPTKKPTGTSSTLVAIAGVLMAGFFVWMLIQMAPHGPKHGEMLISLVVGLVGTVLGVAVVLGLLRLLRRHS